MNKRKTQRGRAAEPKRPKLARETVKDLAPPPFRDRGINGGVFSVAWTYQCGKRPTG